MRPIGIDHPHTTVPDGDPGWAGNMDFALALADFLFVLPALVTLSRQALNHWAGPASEICLRTSAQNGCPLCFATTIVNKSRRLSSSPAGSAQNGKFGFSMAKLVPLEPSMTSFTRYSPA